MRCPKCQTENREGRKFCSECGARLVLVCVECGFENLPGEKFCGECGRDLLKPKEGPPIDYSKPQSYTPKFLADKILTTRSSIEGERKLVTVLFADVANYTAMAEKLDPEEVHQIIDGCFKILMDEIHRHEGTINQFTGDGVMALFGAPVAHEDHAQRACYAALSIQKAIGEYGEEIEKDRGLEFKMRIGLNSGPVVVGSIGDDLRMDYTAVGDTTNLASRMEGMARPGAVLISENTRRMARDFFEFEPLGKVRVKGREKALEAYELIKASEIETRIEAAVAKGLTKFVGRQREMGVLKEAFDKACSGLGQVVGIVGDAGVGKSRLILELTYLLPKGEYTHLEGRCLHFGGSMAYLPILDILRSYFNVKEGDAENLIKKKMEETILRVDEALGRVLAPLQDLLSLKVEDEAYLKVEPEQKKEKMFESIRDLLVRESENKPVLMTIEDLHWIDKTSEEFLDYLIGWLPSTHILLMLIYRPEYSHRWGSKPYYTKTGVDQLSTKTSGKLVQSILEGGEVVPELGDLILSRTGGNPLFMEEFIRSLLEDDLIVRRDHRYVLATKAAEIHVPDTIQGIIAARMDRLEENIKRSMQVASVIGRDFAFPILQAITGMREELKSHLLNLQALGFIYEKRLFPELEYVFKHALIQEVAYDSLLIRRRKEIHERIGKAIEQIYPERLEEFYEMLAYHYSKSGNLEKSYNYLKLSGNKATRNYSLWEAFHFYKEAISTLRKVPETEENKKEQIEVRLLMAPSMISLGFPEDSFQILQQGERLSKDMEDEKSTLVFHSRMGHYFTVKGGDPLRGIKYSEKSFQGAERIQDIEVMAPVACDLAVSYNTMGAFLKIVDMVPKVIALLEKTERKSEFFDRGYNVYSVLHAYYGNSLAALGSFEEGEKLCEKGLRFALDINHLYTLGLIEYFYGGVCLAKGDGKDVVEHCQKSVKYCEEGQGILMLGFAWSGLGYGYYLLGELETARRHIEKGLKIQQDAGIPQGLSIYYVSLSVVHFDSGDLKKAQGCAEKALELSQKGNARHVEGLSSIWLGRISGKKDPSQSHKAEESILGGIKILEGLNLRPLSSGGYATLGEFYADTGQQEKALENLKKAEGMFRDMGMDYYLTRTQQVLGRL